MPDHKNQDICLILETFESLEKERETLLTSKDFERAYETDTILRLEEDLEWKRIELSKKRRPELLEKINNCLKELESPIIQAVKDFRNGKIDRETLIRIYTENEMFSTLSVCMPSRNRGAIKNYNEARARMISRAERERGEFINKFPILNPDPPKK